MWDTEKRMNVDLSTVRDGFGAVAEKEDVSIHLLRARLGLCGAVISHKMLCLFCLGFFTCREKATPLP